MGICASHSQERNDDFLGPGMGRSWSTEKIGPYSEPAIEVE